jgi:hypothetical protein
VRAAALALVVLGLLAPAAGAGQIVWSTDSGIWAMNDDGNGPHELVSLTSPALASSLPRGSLASPDVLQVGGTAVLFLGQTNAYAPSAQPQACGADCSATYELSGGKLTELGPPAAAAAGAAYYESQPRVTADGQELFGSSLYTGIAGSSLPPPAQALVERPLTQSAPVTAWGPTVTETEPGSGFDGTPDPANPTLAVWAEAQGCNFSVTGAAGATQASCQYSVQIGTVSSGTGATVVIYDNEYASADGHGPTSLALSSDGSTLLMVDPYAPPAGIYTTPVAGVAGMKPVTEVLAQPAGWTFGQARFAGTKIVFDAHRDVHGRPTGDIYTVPASCNTTTCSFPTDATNLTNDPAVDSSDPAWTSATVPLQALPSAPRVTAVVAAARSIRAGGRLRLTIKLSAAGTIVVAITERVRASTHSRTVGSLSVPGKLGSNRLSIASVAGHALKPGSYTATVSLSGSSAPPKTIHFTVRS